MAKYNSRYNKYMVNEKCTNAAEDRLNKVARAPEQPWATRRVEKPVKVRLSEHPKRAVGVVMATQWAVILQPSFMWHFRDDDCCVVLIYYTSRWIHKQIGTVY